MQQFEIDDTAAESRLDRYLRRQVEGLTQGMIQKLLRTGKIRVNGKKAEASQHLAAGDLVLVPDIAAPEKPRPERQVMTMDAHAIRDLQAMILYKDDAVIVLNKPAGLAAQGGTGITKHLDGMLDALRFESAERPKLVHRLDKDTSGVLVLGRGAKAAQKLTAAFRGRDVQKTYWALLWGVPDQLEGRIDLPLLRVEAGGVSRSEPASRRDKEALSAVTGYKILDRAAKKFSWAELSPQTGRMHQLRAHMLALGTPIIGDAAYGNAFFENFSPQLHLHARRLKIPHPEGGVLAVEAPLPKHMQEAFSHLGFHAPDAAKPQRNGK